MFGENLGIITDIKTGPDGFLYVLSMVQGDAPGWGIYGSGAPTGDLDKQGPMMGVLFRILPEPQIPDWIRNNAEWWAQGAIGDNDFVSGIQYLIKEGIMQIPETSIASTAGESNEVPVWIKNNADWWSQGLISDDDFVKGIQYLVEQGIIQV